MMKFTRFLSLVLLFALVLSACSVAAEGAVTTGAEAPSSQSGNGQNPQTSSGDGGEVNLLELPDPEEDMGDEVNEKGIVIVSPGITGVSAKVKVGDLIVVRIPTIPTEGFQWMPDRLDTARLEQVGVAEYTADAAADAAGGIVTLQFNALAPGTVNVTLVYTNAGSGKDPAFTKNTFGFELTIE